MFLKSIFPNDVSGRISTLIKIVASGFSLVVLLTPTKLFTQINPLYQGFSLIVIAYVLYIVITVCYKKREGSYLIGMGITILVLFSLNDIIFLSIILADSDSHFLRSFITRGNLSSWGLMIFVFTQSLVLAKKSSKSFSKVELLTEQLQQLNVNLEEKVNERTLALETSREELKKAYKAVSRSEKSLQDFMQNISHDLRTPLSTIKGYTNAILDGIEVCQELRKKISTPIIFLSCKSTPSDKSLGLIAGGDDYMSKPFDSVELLARVKAHLRRNRMLENSNVVDASSRLICYPNLSIDLNSYTVIATGQEVILSPKEFQLLVLLAQNPNAVISNEQLFQSLWGTDSFGDYRTVMVHISNLRKKIEQDPKKPLFIHTIKGVGYKFCIP